MPKFNKKQLAYLDKLVEETPTRMELAQKMFDSHNIDLQMARLGRVWETQWSDVDRYVSDKFNEVHGAGYSISKYY